MPTVLVDGELFWGFDAFVDVDVFLAGHDPVDAARLSRWRAIPAAAIRGGPHHGLTHVSLAVADLQRSARFYGALGYVPHSRDTTSVRVVRPRGHEVIALELNPAHAGARGGVGRFGFRLTTPGALDDVLASVLAAGGTLIRRAPFAPETSFACVADPDGYEVELSFE